ncbi:conserved hypothetical protein [Ricinus communis]|uniref:Uncharacterized protein n=1 Tax=Ricinus communis TaxID=3988 RepID=B9RUN7_RICCO|nr:conserved hypothetical protein [Ricinus communis]
MEETEAKTRKSKNKACEEAQSVRFCFGPSSQVILLDNHLSLSRKELSQFHQKSTISLRNQWRLFSINHAQ